MKRILLQLLALCGLAAGSSALQFDLLASRVDANTQLSDMSATARFSIDGVFDAIRPATLIAGPDGSPLKYHFQFDYDNLYLPMQDEGASVTYDTLRVTVCENMGWRRFANSQYGSVASFPISLSTVFGPGGSPWGNPFPACPATPICSLSPATLDFGSTVSPTNVTRTFTITNTGEAGSTLAGTVTEQCAEYSILSGADYSLGAGASQTVTVELSGATPGTFNCELSTGGICSPIPCTGIVTLGPACTIDPLSLDFGSTDTDVEVTRTFTVTNSGGGTLSGTVSESCAPYSIVSGGTYSLGAGESQTVTVSLLSGTAGVFNCDVATGDLCAPVACSGTVLQGPICSVDPISLDFGTSFPGTPVTRTFTITNSGEGTLSGTVAETCADYSISSGETYSLGAGQSQIVSVIFESNTPGAYPCALDTGGSCADVSCTAVVEALPACGVSTASLSFGTTVVDVPVSREFTITNTGGGTLSGTVDLDCSGYTITGGAAYSLTAGQSQVVTLQLLSATPGIYTCTVNSGGDCADVDLSGVVEPAPVCVVDPASLDFGSTFVGTPVERSFTITNTGGGTLSGTVTETSDDYAVTSGGSYSLGAGQSQTVTVTLTATAAGTITTTVDSDGACADVSCTALVDLNPVCDVSVGSLDFGVTPRNTMVWRSFSITNTGGGTLTGTVTESCAYYLIELDLANGRPGLDNNRVNEVPYSLTAGQSIYLVAAFGGDVPGSYPCTISVGGSCPDITCTGVVDQDPACFVSTASLDFGNVIPDTAASLDFTITNTGGGTLSGTVSTGECVAYSITAGASYSLAAGQSQTVTVQVLSATPGTFTCNLDTGAGCASVACTAVVDYAAICSLDADSLDFGNVPPGTIVDRTFTITNTGAGTLSGTVTESCDAYTILSGASYSLTAQQSQVVTVRMQSATQGTFTCNLETGGLCAGLPCSGVVEALPACHVSPGFLNFGTLLVGQEAELSFTVSNVGGHLLTGSFTESCPEFSIVSGADYNLGAGQEQVVTIHFQAAASGSYACPIIGVPSCVNSVVPCIANVLDPAECSVGPTSLDFGLTQVGVPATRTFTITNTGYGVMQGTVGTDSPLFTLTTGATYDLAHNQSQTVTIQLLSGATGTFTCTATVTGVCATAVACTGEVEPAAACLVSASSLDFGLSLPNAPVERSFTITNTGGGTLSGSVALGCGGHFALTSPAAYSLGGGQSQTFTVDFLSATPGVFSCDLDTGGACADVALSGEVQVAPACSVSAVALDFGTALPGETVTRDFTITNSGGHTLSGTVTEECAAFSIVSGAAYSLTAGQSQTVTVAFQADATGEYPCSVDTGGDCADVSCTAVVDPAPACAVDPASLDFGLLLPNESATRSFTITNTGGRTLSGTVSENCDGYSIVSGAAYSLTAGQSQTVTIELLSAVPGIFACTLDSGGACADVACSGAVEASPDCAVNPASLDFGLAQPNEVVTRSFTITNTGGHTLSGSVTEQCNAYTITAGGTYSLTAGQSQTVTVAFQAAATGSYPCTLASGAPCADVACTAAVDLPPACAVDPLALDFGTVLPDVPVTRTFTVTNTGGGTLSGSVTEGCGAYAVTAPATYSLTAGQSHTFTVTFQSASPGTFPCTLDTGGDCADVACAGTVELAPACTVNPTALDFGTVLANTAVTRTFTISNTGGGTLVGTVTESCPAFSILSGAAYSLTAGQSQTVTVQFQSATPGPQVCSLDTGGSCTDVAATGAVLSVSVAVGPESACGAVDVLGHLPGSTTGYLIDWTGGLVGLTFSPAPAAGVTVSILVDGVSQFSGAATAPWHAGDHLSLAPWIDEDVELHFQVSDGTNTWNSAGSVCLWDLTFLTVTQQSMPKAFALREPAPNPFNPVTRLRLEIPAPDQVSLTVVDLQGRHVDTLFQGPLATGVHDFVWQPRNVASGSYFIVATGRQDRQIQRVLFLK